MKTIVRLVSLAAFLLVVSGPVKADTQEFLFYDLTGPVTATFLLPVNPVLDPANVDLGFGFTLTPIDLMIDGAPSSDTVAFYSTSLGGGFAAFPSVVSDDFSLLGLQLYTGSEDAPTFFIPSDQPVPFTDIDTGDDYSLRVSGPAKVPEPSSLLTLGMGLVTVLAVLVGMENLR
jgi:hypothetical protein